MSSRTTFTSREAETLFRLSIWLRGRKRSEDSDALFRIAQTRHIPRDDKTAKAVTSALGYVMAHASTPDLSLLAYIMQERIDEEMMG